MAREDDGGGTTGAPALDDGFFMVNAQPLARMTGCVPTLSTSHRPGSASTGRGIIEVHPVGTLGCNWTEAAHPYITTHPEMRTWQETGVKLQILSLSPTPPAPLGNSRVSARRSPGWGGETVDK